MLYNKLYNKVIENDVLLWIAKDYEFCQYTQSVTSPLAKGESIAQIVNDVMEGLYPNVMALWYHLEEKKVTLAFRKERGGQ
jgi:hypothetical protein